MTTLRQVAQTANVSIKTASRAVNGDDNVSVRTRREVLHAAAQVGYVPNRAAQMMRSGQSRIVGLLAHMVTTSPFATDILRAVEAVVEQSGRALLINDVGRQGAAAGQQTFREFRADPVLFAASWHQSAEGLFEPSTDRAVLINCFLNRPGILSFVPDDEGGGYVQAKHILSLGHERVGMIELPGGMIARDLRRRGVDRAFAEAGVALDPALVLTGQVGSVDARRTVAFEAASAMLSRADRPTAILCSKDEFALQAYGAAAALGLRIPDDVSIIGYDDMAVIAANMRPALTTIALPYYEMGRQAALAAICREDRAAGLHKIACPLVERDSCRPA